MDANVAQQAFDRLPRSPQGTVFCGNCNPTFNDALSDKTNSEEGGRDEMGAGGSASKPFLIFSVGGAGCMYAEDLREFAQAHFGKVGSDSLPWQPTDWEESAVSDIVDRLPVRTSLSVSPSPRTETLTKDDEAAGKHRRGNCARCVVRCTGCGARWADVTTPRPSRRRQSGTRCCRCQTP